MTLARGALAETAETPDSDPGLLSSGIVLGKGPCLEARGISKSFHGVPALEDVSFRLRSGSFHALLGENGAGKSTLVKCLIGLHQPERGELFVGGTRVRMSSPREAQRHGLGMVMQHFSLFENLSVAENLVLSRAAVPAVIDWRGERAAIEAFMAEMPFRVAPERLVRQLSPGEKQKLEILKQLYLGSRIVILDEPTSVLTPQEADHVLGLLREMVKAGEVSIVMITHKFREVAAFADEVTILRRGRLAGGGPTDSLTADQMVEMMVREAPREASVERVSVPAVPILEVKDLSADDQIGLPALQGINLCVHSGEIVGIAGVSGNGQEELVEVLAGQATSSSGGISIRGKPFRPTRKQIEAERVRVLPESPLRSACVPEMSLAENLAFRCFDAPGFTIFGYGLRRKPIRRRARQAIVDYRIRAQSPDSPLLSLSGGNVQRAVLARELDGEVALLIAANPCFGLDFASVSEIRTRILAARNAGTAVLLVSADLEEILALSDRILVMSDGRIVHETSAARADVAEIGRHMAGHHAP